MGRRKKCRIIGRMPGADLFKPHGIPAAGLRGVVLPVDGLEAFRLVDGEGLSQEEAAERMDVSRPTLCRILADARRTVAKALSEGWAIRIETGDHVVHRPGGDPEMETLACRRHGRGPCGRGMGRGGGNRNKGGNNA